ncbi:MAG TPA: chemotaxis protein CheA [bacterium]
MPTLEQIAAEVVLLSPEDSTGRVHLEKMLRGVAQSEEFVEPVRDLAWQAIATVQSLMQSKDPDSCLKTLNRLLDQMILAETAPAVTVPAEAAPVPEAPPVADESLVADFLGKQDSVLAEFEAHCLAYENGDTDGLSAVKRQIHTWKGEASVLLLHDLATMLHAVEDELESTSLEPKPLGENLLFLADQIKIYFGARRSAADAGINAETILAKFRPAAAPATATVDIPAPVAAAVGQVFEMPAEIDMDLLHEFCNESEEHFQQAEQALMTLEADPSDKEAVNVVFRAFHTVKGTSGFVGLGCVTELAHKAETFFDRLRKGTLVMQGVYTDLAFEALDMLKGILRGTQGAIESGRLPLPPLYADLLKRLEHVGTAPASAAVPAAAVIERAPAAQASDAASGSAETSGEAVESKAADGARGKRTGQAESDGSVKVSTGRLDNMINMVGELVIAQSMVSQDPVIQNGTDQRLIRNVSQLNKITRSLQELALSMRMVSVKATFQKMARLVRDLARKANKEILFETEGEDTELDRNMVEAIADPLVHMVRNAADHGLETPDDRVKAGKPRQGIIRLRAAHEGGSVLITLTDDGRGLNKQKILAKAIERGIVEPNAQLSDSEIHNLIFMPGFSTADKITDVSGRGVGMDVVRTNVEALRGTVEISSKPGEGSVFSVRLPLTLAIIDGMVIRAGSERFILPIISITETFRPRPEDLSTVQGQTELVLLRGDLIPVCRLERAFHIADAGRELTESILVVIEHKGRRLALMVDELLGQQQVVIKSLGSTFGNVAGVSGGAILGDGRISLILDVDGLMRLSSGANRVL